MRALWGGGVAFGTNIEWRKREEVVGKHKPSRMEEHRLCYLLLFFKKRLLKAEQTNKVKARGGGGGGMKNRVEDLMCFYTFFYLNIYFYIFAPSCRLELSLSLTCSLHLPLAISFTLSHSFSHTHAHPPRRFHPISLSNETPSANTRVSLRLPLVLISLPVPSRWCSLCTFFVFVVWSRGCW